MQGAFFSIARGAALGRFFVLAEKGKRRAFFFWVKKRLLVNTNGDYATTVRGRERWRKIEPISGYRT